MIGICSQFEFLSKMGWVGVWFRSLQKLLNQVPVHYPVDELCSELHVFSRLWGMGDFTEAVLPQSSSSCSKVNDDNLGISKAIIGK